MVKLKWGYSLSWPFETVFFVTASACVVCYTAVFSVVTYATLVIYWSSKVSRYAQVYWRTGSNTFAESKLTTPPPPPYMLFLVDIYPQKKYTALRLVPRRSLLIPLSARSLGESGPVSLGDVTAHGRVQEWPSRERLGTRLDGTESASIILFRREPFDRLYETRYS